MSTPRFSIVTITFNAADALRRTLESVNAQTFAGVEQIVVDGGSTDGSVEVIARCGRRVAWWVSEPDAGIADAFNKATRQASGDYICYLNAGDVFAAHDVLERVAARIGHQTSMEPTIYFGDFVSSHEGVQRLHHASAALEDFAWDNPINHQSAFVPRSLAQAQPYDVRLTLGMDYDFWLRAMKTARFEQVPGPIAIFELGGRSSASAWVVHSLIIHRTLWHVNRGSRLGAGDWVGIATRAIRLKLKLGVRRLLGRRLAGAIRAAKSRRLTRLQASAPTPA